MKKILSILIEEFRGSLPETEDSVERAISLPDVPGMINVAIGMRRSGKTYLLYQKIRELLREGVELDQILFLNFEDDRLLPMSHKELGVLIDAFYSLYPENHDRLCYLFLDEIQNVEGWPLTLRRLLDSRKLKLFVTGSSAKLLSREIASSLRGRSIATEVFPYSFYEFQKAQNIEPPPTLVGNKALDQFSKHLRNYFQWGGFPAVQKLHGNERRTVLQTYIDTVVFRDIIERYKITNSAVVKYIIKTLINNVATPFTVNKFYKDLKSQGLSCSKSAVYHYIDYIEEAFLAFQVPLFSQSIRKIQMNPKKTYIVDNGLVCAKQIKFGPAWGNLFENQIYLDLRRAGKKIAYYLTKEGYEVDFVVENRDGSFELIQAVWNMDDPKTLERETRALACAKEELGMPGRIITAEDYLRGLL